jgi:cell division protein FtsB
MIQKNLNNKIKKIGAGAAVIIVVMLMGFLFFGKNSIINLHSSHLDAKKKEQEIKKAHEEIDSLTIESKRLKNDTAYIEKIARENLGMAGKKEKVYKFIEGK